MLFRTMLVPANRAKLVTYTGVNPCKYITVHQTGNTNRGANADMHARLQYNGNSRSASWHEQVDDKECVQSFAHTAKCWHGGDGRTGAGNNESIAIEICVNSDGDYTRAVRNGARRVSQLMKMYNIPISRVVQHNHWSGKACPAQIRAGKNGINWSAFLKIVQEELDGPNDGVTVTQKEPLELAPKPTPAPSTPVLSATVKARLKRMGLPQNAEGVKTFQRAHDLYPDGEWGGVTDTYWRWVETLQTKLNQWKAVNPKLYVDGFRGRKTTIAEDAVIARNRGLVGSTRASLYRYLGIPEPAKRP